MLLHSIYQIQTNLKKTNVILKHTHAGKPKSKYLVPLRLIKKRNFKRFSWSKYRMIKATLVCSRTNKMYSTIQGKNFESFEEVKLNLIDLAKVKGSHECIVVVVDTVTMKVRRKKVTFYKS